MDTTMLLRIFNIRTCYVDFVYKTLLKGKFDCDLAD